MFFNFRRFLALCVFVLAATVLHAEEPQPTAATPENKENVVVKEQTVYVPYDKLHKSFEKDGRGVFLPYDEFQKLWDAARKDSATPKPTDAPPLPAIITETESNATVAEEIVNVEAKIFIELLKNGWNEIPLRLADAAITKATIGDQPARILGEPGQGFRLLVEKKEGKPSERIELVIHYAKKIDKTPGRNSVSFEVPQSPISRWKFFVQESGVKVDFAPLIAASEEKPAGDAEKKGTTVSAFVGPTPQVRIGWTPKTEGATGLDALTAVQLQQRLTISEGILRTEARFDYTISRAQITSLAIRVPNDQKVVSVFDPNVKKWSVGQGKDAQTINVDLFEPAKDKQTVLVELEKLSNNEPRITVPALEAVGVGRQQGVLAVRTSDGLTSETVKTTGLLRMDLSELPEALRQNNVKWDAAYRISSAAYGLELSVAKVEPRITATSQIAVRLSEELLQLDMQTVFNIERTGVFKLLLDIPEGFEIRSVRGFNHGNIQPVQVDNFNLAGTPRCLTVNLSRKAFGVVGLAIQLERKLSEPDLQSPTGKTVDLSVVVPTVTKNSVELSKGELIVQAKPAFRLNPLKTEGIQPVSLQQIYSNGESPWRLKTDDAQLGFLFSEGTPSFDLRVERRKPQLTVQEIQTVRIDDGSVKYNVKFFYNVQFSGVKSLRIDIPQSVSGRLNRVGRGAAWRESQLVPQPENVAPGCVAWEYSTETELLGSGVLELAWEDELKQLEIGKPLPLEIPRLIPFKPEPTDRVWGQIILSKSQSIDIGESKETKGLKPIDPQYDVAERDRISDAAAAFEFHDDWSLHLVATRYKLEEMKRTSIERGLVRANLIFSKSGTEIAAQALYRIRSVEQRLELAMPFDANISDVRINGQNVVLESNGKKKNEFMIPLNAVPPDTPFSLEIRYDYSRKGTVVEIPSFAWEYKDPPAVQLMDVAIFVPEEWVVIGYHGDYHGEWSKQFGFREAGAVVCFKNPMGLHNEFENLGRDDFSVSGVPYLFSTLRPDAETRLELTVARKRLSSLLPFCVFVLLGILLMFTGWARRFQIVIGILVLVIIFGFLWPTLADFWAYQSGTAGGVFVVALLWILQAFMQGAFFLREHCKRLPKPEPQPVAEPQTAEPAPQETTEGGPDHE